MEKVREYRANEETREDAVKRAVEDCIREHVLEEFFRSRKDEVIKVTHLDFTWERREELIRKEEREEGAARERIAAIHRMRLKGYAKDQILDLGYTEEEIASTESKKE